MAIGGSPAWSPDGTEIAFLTGWPERMQISLLNVSTHKQKVLFPMQLTDPTFWHFTGDWFDPAYVLPVSPQPQLLTTTWGEVKEGN